MGGSYKRCPQCGGRALSIATRCPGCGGEFPAADVAGGRGGQHPGRSVSLSMPLAVLAGIGIVVVSLVGRTAFPREQRSSLGAAVTAAAPTEVGLAGSGIVTDSAPAPAVVVAHRMIHLRKARSRRAPLEAVLEPGDTLAVDSLAGGWYRVTFEGEVMGYAESSSLEMLEGSAHRDSVRTGAAARWSERGTATRGV